jgi:hypothetical protein
MSGRILFLVVITNKGFRFQQLLPSDQQQNIPFSAAITLLSYNKTFRF